MHASYSTMNVHHVERVSYSTNRLTNKWALTIKVETEEGSFELTTFSDVELFPINGNP